MRPIDADALIKKCGDWYVEEGTESGFIGTLKNLLATMPTIQPEQCGDKSYTLWKESYEELKRRMDELTSCSDIISRQAAIDALDFEIVHITAYCDGKNEGNPLAQYNKGLEDGKKAIEALPPAQPEPHEGEWEQVSAQRYFMSASYFYRCSACGVNNVRNTNYCPNCGADMRGEKDERTD